MTDPSSVSPTSPAASSAPWEKITAVVLGVVFVSVLLGFAWLIPAPTDSQYATFKTVLALAAAGIGAILPGLIHIELPLPKGILRASGAVVLFVLVFFFTPASPASSQATTTGDIQQTIEGGTGVIHTGEGDIHVGK